MSAPRLLPLILLLLAITPAAAQAAAPVAPGVAEHTVTSFRVERGGAVERDERVETWVSARRAKVVYTDAAGAPLGACTGTRRVIRCFDRDPALEGSAAGGGRLFLPSWAETAERIRKGLRRGWLREKERTEHRGLPARRLVSTPEATGDAGDSTLLVQRRTRALLFRRSTSGSGEVAVTSTEDVLSRERLPAASVDFRLNAPAGERVRRHRIGGGR